MHASLTFCEFATAHADGTFTAVRGGINSIRTPTLPYQLRGTILARVGLELGEDGPHEFALRSMDQDGKSLLPEVKGGFVANSAPGSSTMCINIENFPVTAYGVYSLILTVDRQIAARTEITIQKPEAEKKK
jgi:hypothetical protein